MTKQKQQTTKRFYMKTGLIRLFLPLLLVTPLAPNVRAQTTAQPTTAFTYQGKLADNGAPANGNYDLNFRLYNEYGEKFPREVSKPGVHVVNGLFSVNLDFTSAPFTDSTAFRGVQRWLEIDVAQGGAAPVTLTPWTEITPAPRAISAQTAGSLTGPLPSGQLSGTYSSAVSLNNPANSFSGNGAGLTGLAANNMSSGTLADARLSANVALLDHT